MSRSVFQYNILWHELPLLRSWTTSTLLIVPHTHKELFFLSTTDCKIWRPTQVLFVAIFLKKKLIYFQFSVSQFTWQIWQTNNSFESNKPNRIMKKVYMMCLGLKKNLSSSRLELTAQTNAHHIKDQSHLWYHSAIQVAPTSLLLTDTLPQVVTPFR